MNLPKKTIFMLLLIIVSAIIGIAAVTNMYEQDPKKGIFMALLISVTIAIILVRDHFKNKNASKPER